MSAVYDTGLLIAADRNDRDVWADHRTRLELGVVPLTTAPVVAQVSRSPRQVQLRRLLRGCDVVGFAPEQAHEVGELLGRSGTSDVVDAHVALTASTAGATVYTSDEDDLEQLSSRLQRPIVVQRVGPRRRRSNR
jgi:predicted nucleic acid-binding protein